MKTMNSFCVRVYAIGVMLVGCGGAPSALIEQAIVADDDAGHPHVYVDAALDGATIVSLDHGSEADSDVADAGRGDAQASDTGADAAPADAIADNRDAGCMLGELGCNGRQPTLCGASGWQNVGSTCELSRSGQACLRGACVECEPGAISCVGPPATPSSSFPTKQAMTCSPQGSWLPVENCQDGTVCGYDDAGWTGCR